MLLLAVLAMVIFAISPAVGQVVEEPVEEVTLEDLLEAIEAGDAELLDELAGLDLTDEDVVEEGDFIQPISQETEQEAESGDLDQSFDVSGSGDNSNQCVGGQVVGNTGNVQNSSSTLELDSGTPADEDGDEDNDAIEDVLDFFDNDGENAVSGAGGDASIDVSPSNTTDCSQYVEQSAIAVGESVY